MKEFKKVIILGLGVSGKSALRLMDSLGVHIVVVNQGSEQDIRNIIDSVISHPKSQIDVLSDSTSCDLSSHRDSDFVILSPGISREHHLLKDLGLSIFSEIEVASWFIDEPIIGITGTNGKTTTVSFISECFKHSQFSCFTGGNIGRGLCDYVVSKREDPTLKCDYILLELSSFQLESIRDFKTEVSAILNITFSHGERYRLLKDYALAKGEIFKNTKFGIFPKGLWEQISLKCPYQFPFQVLDLNDMQTIEQELRELDPNFLHDLKIYGKHNLINLYFAKKILERLKIDLDCFIKASKTFQGVAFRFQFLGQYNNLEVFNDAKSTNWQASSTALDSVIDRENLYLIIGGQLRGENDFSLEFFKRYESKIKKLILTGESGKKIHETLKTKDLKIDFSYFETLSDIRDYIDKNEIEGTLVYSPAFPSFDQFKNYVDRGECFNRTFNF